MKTLMRKAQRHYVIIAALVLVLVFARTALFEEELQRQYWDESDWVTLDGAEVRYHESGIEEGDGPAVHITEDRSVITLTDPAVAGCVALRVDVTEISNAGFNGYLTADGRTETIWITKGTNRLRLYAPVKGDTISLHLEKTAGQTINWGAIILEKRLPTHIFPFTLLCIALFIWAALLAAALRARKRSQYGPAAVFAAGFIFLLYQMRNVFFYFDDYGYLALSYQHLTEAPHPAGLLDVFIFLREHYLHWGGRVLYFFGEIMYGQSLALIRIVQALHTVLFLYLAFRVMAYEKPARIRTAAAFFPFLLYALLEAELMNDGAYWFTASVLYLFPLLWVVLGSLLLWQAGAEGREAVLGNENKTLRRFIPLILFLAAFSQEQVAAGTAVLVLLITAEAFWRTRRLTLLHIASNLAVFLGAALLLFCPGSAERMRGSEAGDPLRNVVALLNVVSSDSMKYFTCAICLSLCLITVTMLRKNRNPLARIFFFAMGAVSAGFAFVMTVLGRGMLTSLQTVLRVLRLESLNAAVYPLLLLYLLGAFLCLLAWYTVYHRFFYLSALIVGAAATMGVAVFTPGIARRMVLPFYLLMILPVGDCFVNYIAFPRKVKKAVFAAATAALVALAVLNFHYILYGYYRNAASEEHNREILRNYAAHADENGAVYLKRHVDDTFGNMMPYREGYSYILPYMRDYYNLPETAALVYEKPFTEDPADEKEGA